MKLLKKIAAAALACVLMCSPAACASGGETQTDVTIDVTALADSLLVCVGQLFQFIDLFVILPLQQFHLFPLQVKFGLHVLRLADQCFLRISVVFILRRQGLHLRSAFF